MRITNLLAAACLTYVSFRGDAVLICAVFALSIAQLLCQLCEWIVSREFSRMRYVSAFLDHGKPYATAESLAEAWWPRRHAMRRFAAILVGLRHKEVAF